MGYSGGTSPQATYLEVKTGTTGHAEAVEVIYDPDVTGVRDILAFFLQIHDPTTKDRQGNDRGSQYRSAIFYSNEVQRQIATETIATSMHQDYSHGRRLQKLYQSSHFGKRNQNIKTTWSAIRKQYSPQTRYTPD